MPPSQVDWTPAVVVLSVGVVLGLFFIWRAVSAGRAAVSAPAAPDPERRDLEAKRDALIVQLRELEDTAAKRSGDQLAAERYALELEAARVWRALDEQALAVPAAVRAEPSPSVQAAGEAALAAAAAPSAWKGFLWGVGSLSAVLALVVFVSRSAEERKDGGSPTGGGGPMAGGGAAAGDPELERLQAAVAARPDDVTARLDLARAQLMRQDMMGVFEHTQAVLEREPDNPRALSYQSLVRMAMGQPDLAESMLKRAIAKDPNQVDGYVHLMLVYLNMGRARDAEATLATASKKFPDQAQSFANLFVQMRAAASGSETSASGAGSPAGTGGGAAAAAAPAASGRSVTGILSLDPRAAASAGMGGVVYVMLRPAGVREGPPLAAIRLPGSGFPLAFAIGEADAMTGDPIPDKVLLEARLDRDGDVATRDAGDPYGSADGIALGTANLQIVLKPRD